MENNKNNTLEEEMGIYIAAVELAEKEKTLEKDTVCSPIDARLAYNIKKYAEENFVDISKIIRRSLIYYAAKHGLLPTQNPKTEGKYVPMSTRASNAAYLIMKEFQ